MKKVRNHDMLRDDSREFVSISGCKTLNDMISRACKWKIYLEHIDKRGVGPGADIRGSREEIQDF